MPERYEQRPFVVPADATEILLIRHGASADAVPGELFELLEGQADPPLSPRGRRQAQQVAERLAAEPLRRLFVTPLRRTAQTAAPLAERLDMALEVVPELREVHLGEWEGGAMRVRAQTGDPLFARVMEEERWDLIPGAEPASVFSERVRRGIERIAAACGPGTSAAAFVHGGVVAEACREAARSRPFAFLFVDNGSITRLVVLADGRWLLRSFNDICHLG